MRTVTVWLFALALTVLSGCGGDDDDDRAARSAPTAAALAGTTFVSTAVTGHELVEGTTLTLGFPEMGKLTAAAGCNSYFGDFDVTDGKLDVGQLGGTLIGCPPELQQQDEWMAAFLGSEPEIALDGDTLTLTGTDTTIILVDRAVAEPDVALEGVRWDVESLVTVDAVSSVPARPVGLPRELRGRSDHG
jgi:heat shock protein HslJ